MNELISENFPHDWETNYATMPPREHCKECGVMRVFDYHTAQRFIYFAERLVMPIAGQPQCVRERS